MEIRPKPLFIAVLLIGVFLVSCVAPVVPVSIATVPISPLPSPTATTIPPTLTATAVPPTYSGATTKVNVDELMPPAPGREPVLFYCVNCHSIAPIVITRWTETEWTAFVNMFHRDRVPVSEKEWDQMLNYLIVNFPPGQPVPQLPEELADDWTGAWFE